MLVAVQMEFPPPVVSHTTPTGRPTTHSPVMLKASCNWTLAVNNLQYLFNQDLTSNTIKLLDGDLTLFK
jgi:hypothetical protein